jgi:hypothetical protein
LDILPPLPKKKSSSASAIGFNTVEIGRLGIARPYAIPSILAITLGKC